MKIKVGNLRINIRTLIDLVWENYLPKLVVHEKYEKYLKWTIRIITVVSIAAIFIIINDYLKGVLINSIIFIVGWFFSSAIVKYTSIVVEPIPSFPIDYSQWTYVVTPSPSEKYDHDVNIFSFVFKDLNYGNKFFQYLKSVWSFGQEVDESGNICLSIIEEPEGRYSGNKNYTVYIYRNSKRSSLEEVYNNEESINALDKNKKFKLQEQLVMGMTYWRHVSFITAKEFIKFLNFQPRDKPFLVCPSIRDQNGYKFDLKNRIILTHYKYNFRENLTKNDPEYHLHKLEMKNEKSSKK